MEKNEFLLDIDLKIPNYINEPRVRQNDDVYFIINITDDGIPYDLSRVSTITLATERSDRNSVISGVTSTVGNQATFKLPRASVGIVGRATALVQLYDDNNRISTFSFTFFVERDPSNFNPTGDERTLIEIVLGEGPRILSEAEQATIFANEQGDYAKTEADKLATLNAAVTDNEATRIANEQVRQTNESERLSDETDRASSESDRISNEDARILSETARQDAETIRVNQEAQRQTDTSQAIVEALDAAEQARNAQGPQGIQGPKGDQGIQGEKGEKGDKGEPGKDGDGAGTVTSVNNIEPDEFGNVDLGELDTGGVKTVNEVAPDAEGNVNLTTTDINYRADLDGSSLPSDFPIGVTLSSIFGTAHGSLVTYKWSDSEIATQIRVDPLEINIRAQTNAITNSWLSWISPVSLASSSEAKSGTINFNMMTPLRTKEAISAQVTSELVNYDNTLTAQSLPSVFPIGVTVFNFGTLTHVTYVDESRRIIQHRISGKSTYSRAGYKDTDLWDEWETLSYSTATQALVEAGTNNLYRMTPLRTKEAIDYHVGTKMYRGTDEPTLTPDELERGGQFWLKEV